MVNRERIDIYKRIFGLVVNVIKVLNRIPKTPTNLIIINQLTRSVTSMGANGEEADGSSTKKDFVHCFTIVRKEGKETLFWLKLISSTNTGFEDDINPLIQEGNEIIAIVSTIIKKILDK